MRYEDFIKNEYYHVYGGGMGGREIFLDDTDMIRFIFLLTHFQSPIRLYNVHWYTGRFKKHHAFRLNEERVDEILKKRSVELISFALLPNEFDILIKNLEDQILSVFMHRVLTAYGKYFNAKYRKSGHVFRGPFQAIRITKHGQLPQLSAYIHKRPAEAKEWYHSYDQYPWSTYQDFIGLNRWGRLISPEIVLKQFKNQTEYKDFVVKSITKNPLI